MSTPVTRSQRPQTLSKFTMDSTPSTPMPSPVRSFLDLERREMALVIREARRRTGNTRLFPLEIVRDIVRNLDMDAPIQFGLLSPRTPVYQGVMEASLCDTMPTPRRLNL